MSPAHAVVVAHFLMHVSVESILGDQHRPISIRAGVATIRGQNASKAPVLDGDWDGVLCSVDTCIRIVLHLQTSGGNLNGKLDSPDQSVFDIPIDSIDQSSRHLTFDVKRYSVHFDGVVETDNRIVGTWTKGSSAVQLRLDRKGASGRAHPSTDRDSPPS